MEKKSQKPYRTDYCLLIVYDLWQAHYQILLLILLKKFKKLNVKMNMNKKLNTKKFEYANFRDNLIEHKCLYCNKNYPKSLMKT